MYQTVDPAPSSSHPTRDDVVADRYRLEKELGSADRVRTWLARDTVLDGPVVVRFATPELVRLAGGEVRFQARLKTLAWIDHPGSVRITDMGRHEDMPFVVVQRARGADLGAIIDRGNETDRSFEPEAVLTRLYPVARALDAMHARGIVHGDVRPASILLTGDGSALLADGLGGCPRPAGSDATALIAPSQAAYIAPEQVRGLAAGAASDQYALAVTVFEVLSGRPPQQAVAPMAVAVERLSTEAPRLDVLRPDMPETVADVLARALDREPEARFASCEELVEAVRDAFTQGDETTPPVQMPVHEKDAAETYDLDEDEADEPAMPVATPIARRPRRAARRAASRGRDVVERARASGFGAEPMYGIIAGAAIAVAVLVLPWISLGGFTVRATSIPASMGYYIIGLGAAAAALAGYGRRLYAHIAAWGALGLTGYDAFRIISDAGMAPIGLGMYLAAAASAAAIWATAGGDRR